MSQLAVLMLNVQNEPVISPVIWMVKLFIPGPQKDISFAYGDRSGAQEVPHRLGCVLHGMGRVRVECSPTGAQEASSDHGCGSRRMGCEVMGCSPLDSMVEVCGPRMCQEMQEKQKQGF